jgi:hypothetical protein
MKTAPCCCSSKRLCYWSRSPQHPLKTFLSCKKLPPPPLLLAASLRPPLLLGSSSPSHLLGCTAARERGSREGEANLLPHPTPIRSLHGDQAGTLSCFLPVFSSSAPPPHPPLPPQSTILRKFSNSEPLTPRLARPPVRGSATPCRGEGRRGGDSQRSARPQPPRSPPQPRRPARSHLQSLPRVLLSSALCRCGY